MAEKRFEEKELYSLRWVRCSKHGWHCRVEPYRNGTSKPRPAPLVENDWFRRGAACYYTPPADPKARKLDSALFKARIVGIARTPGKVWILVDFSRRNGFAGVMKHEWRLNLVDADTLSPFGAGIEPPPALPPAWSIPFDKVVQTR